MMLTQFRVIPKPASFSVIATLQSDFSVLCPWREGAGGGGGGFHLCWVHTSSSQFFLSVWDPPEELRCP